MEMLGYGTTNARAARRGMRRDPYALTGAVFGLVTLLGALSIEHGALQGRSVSASSVVAGTLTVSKSFVAQAHDVGVLTGQPSRPPFIGVVAGRGETKSRIQTGFEKGGSVTGTSLVTDVITVRKRMIVDATSKATGRATLFKGGFSALISTGARPVGLMTVKKPLQSSVSGLATVGDALTAQKALKATSAGLSTIQSRILIRTALFGNIDQHAQVSGAVTTMKRLNASHVGQATASGALTVQKGLIADNLGRSGAAGKLDVRAALFGHVDQRAVVAGAMIVEQHLAAQLAKGTGSVSANDTIAKSLEARANGTSKMDAALFAGGQLLALTEQGATVTGALTINKAFGGKPQARAIAAGTFVTAKFLDVTSHGVSTALGQMTVKFNVYTESGARRAREEGGARLHEIDSTTENA